MRKGEGGRKEETAGSYMTSGSSSAASDLGKESLYAGQYLQRVEYFMGAILISLSWCLMGDCPLPLPPPPCAYCEFSAVWQL